MTLPPSAKATLPMPPLPPGTSPCRTKGLTYRALAAHAEATVPGGWRAVVDSLPSELGSFAAQPFLVGGWYDFLPVLPLAACASELAGAPHDAWLSAAARAAATGQARGIYRFLPSLVSDEKIALWMLQLASRYFEFGTTVAERVRPGHVRVIRSGTPAFCAHWYRLCSTEYVLAAIDLARGRPGAARIASRITRTDRDAVSRLPVVTVEFDCFLR
jgi:hypothetical protein